jgi:hypothetical protein
VLAAYVDPSLRVELKHITATPDSGIQVKLSHSYQIGGDSPVSAQDISAVRTLFDDLAANDPDPAIRLAGRSLMSILPPRH